MDSAANSSGASLPSVPSAAARKPAPRPAAAAPAPARGRCRLTLEQEVDVLIRARYPIIFIRTYEEERAEHLLRSIAERRNKKLLVWTVTQGIQKPEAEAARGKPGGRTNDPLTALDSILDSVEPAIFLMKDFHPFMMPTPCNRNGHIIRRLRDAAIQLRDTYKTIVVVGPLLNLAPELEKDVTILDFPLPTTREFNALLDRIVSDVKENSQLEIAIDNHDRERLFHAARGLTLREAENVFAKTLVVDGKLTADDIDMVYGEKQQIIRKSGLLEYYESDERLGHVAGLNNLKDWFKKRSIAFSDQAARFGLPSPRGVLLLGVQGCGKSLIAKAVSSFWRLPLLRFDVGRMFSSLVGSSEENVRRAIQTAESVAPAILWIDEIDKALAGSTGSAGSDGGTSSRVFGTLLTWLSEKSSSVFVIATANDISHLPPELLRKGRLDEIFFVDLPNAEERKDVFQIHIQRRGRDASCFDLDALARACEGYSGAEIEESVVSGLFDAFSQKSDLTTDILLNSLQQTVPLSRTMSEELNRLRTWAAGRARPATGTEAVPKPEARRKIELV